MHNNPELVYRASDDPFHFIVPLKDAVAIISKTALGHDVEDHVFIGGILWIERRFECHWAGKKPLRQPLNLAKQRIKFAL